MKKSTFSAKLTKTAALLLLLALVTVMFTSCSLKKEAVTTDDFKALAAEKGLQCSDATDQFAGYDFVKAVTIAHPEDVSYKIEFYDFSDTSNAQSFFNTNKADFGALATGQYSSGSLNGQNYASYSLTSGDKYMFVEYVGNTAIFVNTDKANKSVIEEFVKALKY